MKRKLTLLLAALILSFSAAVAAIQDMLREAQNMLNKATTEQQVKEALQTFRDARKAIDYSPQQHEPIISDGIAQCNRRLAAMARKLIVNGVTTAVTNNMPASGGQLKYIIKSTVGAPEIENLPEWISVQSVTPTEVILVCSPNSEYAARQENFTFSGGGSQVNASVRQEGVPRPTNTAPAEAQGRERPVVITDVQFSNTSYDNTVITAAGQPLYAYEMRYLHPVVTYEPSNIDKTVKLKVRIYKPDGEMYYIENYSPVGYTQGYDQEFPSNMSQLSLMGFGHRRKSVFEPGQYRFEFYFGNKHIYTAYATITEREDDETYLMVNGLSRPVLELDGNGGTSTFYISTSDDDWEVTELPSWLKLDNLNERSLTLSYGPNDAVQAREGEFYLTGAGRQVTVKVKQPTNGASAQINNLEITENATVNGEKGLLITSDLVFHNADRHRCQIVAWFYNQNGQPLMDADGKYRAGDGQVTVNKDVTVNSDDMQLPKFTLFIPYEQLDLSNPGEYQLEFDMGIYDFAMRDFIASTRRIKFTYIKK